MSLSYNAKTYGNLRAIPQLQQQNKAKYTHLHPEGAPHDRKEINKITHKWEQNSAPLVLQAMVSPIVPLE